MKHLFLALTALLFISSGQTATAALSVGKLAETDPFQVAVSEMAVVWADGNISTGTTSATALQIKSKLPATATDWKGLALELFKSKYKAQLDEELPANAKVRVSSYKMKAKSIEAAVDAVAESNAYNTENEETMDEIETQLNTMLEPLGDAKDIQFLAIKTRLMSDVTESMRDVRIHLFVNVTNGKTLSIFTIEGTM